MQKSSTPASDSEERNQLEGAVTDPSINTGGDLAEVIPLALTQVGMRG
jgi:hypothetical protein